MPTALPIEVLPAMPGPSPLDLLHAVSTGDFSAGECTLLHSATNTTFSVFARVPYAAIEVDAGGIPRTRIALPEGVHPLEAAAAGDRCL